MCAEKTATNVQSAANSDEAISDRLMGMTLDGTILTGDNPERNTVWGRDMSAVFLGRGSTHRPVQMLKPVLDDPSPAYPRTPLSAPAPPTPKIDSYVRLVVLDHELSACVKTCTLEAQEGLQARSGSERAIAAVSRLRQSHEWILQTMGDVRELDVTSSSPATVALHSALLQRLAAEKTRILQVCTRMAPSPIRERRVSAISIDTSKFVRTFS